MKLAASIFALARADLWSAKWNPFSSPSACTGDKVGAPDFGGSCLEGTDCCYLCPDPEKENYKVPVISCGGYFYPSGCATSDGEGCNCNPLSLDDADDADLFSVDYIFDDPLKLDPSPLNDCSPTAEHECDPLTAYVENTKNCASKMQNSVQNKESRSDGKINRMQTNEGYATLSGVHQHMTYHIEEPLKDTVGKSIEEIFNDVCSTSGEKNFKDCLTLQVELNNVQVRIDGQFSALDDVLAKLEERNNALLSLLAKLETEEVENCPNRVCQCEEGYYWDAEQLKCIKCIGVINEDGVCEECPKDTYYDPEQNKCVKCGKDFEPIWILYPDGPKCHPDHVGDKDECCRPCDPDEEDWNPVFEICMPKIRESFGTGVVLLVGGNDIYQETTDAIVFCPGATSEEDMQFVGDVIDNQAYKSTMKAHSATFNPFYYNQTGLNNAYSRLIFGGIGSEEVVRCFVDSDYQGNNQGLAERPLAAYLIEQGEEVDEDMWHIPTNTQPRQNGESGDITEVGKKRHRGITCRPDTACFPDNFLIGGQIDGSHASRALYRWDFRGFVDKDPDVSNGHTVAWNAAPPLIEGRRDFAAVALASSDRFCKMILVCGGEGSKPTSDPIPNYLSSCECLTNVDGNNEWVRFAHDLPYPTIGSELVAVLNISPDGAGEEIYHLGGDQIRSSGPVPTNYIRKLTTSGWQDIATMHHARGFHRSWVSYGWDAVPSYELPLIFSVGGDGNSVMELEVFDITTRYSRPLVDEATFQQRFDFDIMQFGNCLFDLDDLPFYEDPCVDYEYCIA